MTEPRRFPVLPILVLFIGSGMAGLVYEIVWVRMFGLVMGNTVFSITTVLSAFMGGLALGSAWGGRRAARSPRPIRAYALLELGIGLYCLAVPWLILGLTPICRILYRDLYDRFLVFHSLLFLLGAAVLVPATAMMGATLPFLSRALGGEGKRLGTRLGDLYAANTIGAVAGALGAGFVLLPSLGVQGANRIAVAANLGIALLAWILSRRREVAVEPARPEAPEPAIAPAFPAGGRPFAAALLFAFGASGAASLAYQIAWTRALAMVIGMSTYAFTTIVGAFILGIAAGSAILGRLADRTGRPVALLVGCLGLVGLVGPLSPWVLGRLPLWLLDFFAGGGEVGFARLQLALFGRLFLLLLPPTILFGGAFPLVTRALAPEGADARAIAPLVGRAYAVNTVGAIAGSILCGFVLIPSPAIGIQGALAAAGGLVLVAAAAVAVLAPGSPPGRRAGVAAALVAAGAGAILLAPRWDPVLMGAGVYLYGPDYVREARVTRRPIERVIEDRGRVLLHTEGVSSTVQVKLVEKKGQEPVLVLLVNGKPEATTRGDMRTQTLLGHLAPLYHPRPRTGLVIGLGGGLTLASMATHGLERLDCLEISSSVADAARRDDFGGPSFADANRRVLDRDEVRLIVGDGRTHVTFSEATYDVISSQPSNPWIAGVANLFTVEFFGAVRDRLAEGGLFCQWVQAYRMSVDDFRMIVRTFRTVFPDAWLFKTQSTEYVTSGDYLLLGGRGAGPSMEALAAALARAEVGPDLASIGIVSALDAVEGCVLGPRELAAFAGPGPLNTDDNAHLEFSSPKSFYESGGIRMLAALLEHRGPRPAWWGGEDAAAGGRWQAMTELYRSIVAWAGRDHETALERARAAVRLDPGRRDSTEFVIRLLGDRAQVHRARGRLDEAIADHEEILRIDRTRPEPWLKIGELQAEKGLLARAEESFRRVRDLPGVDALFVADAHANLAGLYFSGFGDNERARRSVAAALAIDPTHVQALYIGGVMAQTEGRFAEAADLLARAVEGGGERTDVLNRYADVLSLAGRDDEALDVYETSLELDEEQGVVHRTLGQLRFDRQDFDRALEHLDRAKALGTPIDEALYRNARQGAGR